MEMIERYIYAVLQKLPVKQRADIEQELRSLIEDMLEERAQGEEPAKADVEQVLLELGSPSDLADRYRDSKQYLIGPEMFASYMMVMKISLVAVSIAMTVVFAIETILTPQLVLEHFTDNLVGLILSYFQAFTWVTIIFAMIDYFGIQKGRIGKATHAWRPSDLPALPDHRTEIKRSTPITSIIFHVLFAILFIFSIDLIGIWRIWEGNSIVVPFFDPETFARFLPAILAITAVSIIKDIIMIIQGRWTLTLVSMEVIITVLAMAAAIWMFADHTIWNPDFMQGLVHAGLFTADSEAYQTVNSIWTTVQDIILYLIAITVVIQIVTMIIKAYRIKNNA